MDGILSSVLVFQLYRLDRQTCYQHNPSKDVIKKAEKKSYKGTDQATP